MQRPGRRAVKVQEVVAALCNLLTAAGLDSVPTPEAFRRAKFNCGPEVEDPFWRLLASVLKTANIISVEAFPKLSGASDYRKLVAVGLWQSGYHTDWIKCVGERGEQCGPCSRDLLLALGWLLATGTLETLLAHRAQQLDATRLEPAGVTPPTVHGALLDRPSLRKLQWLIGCLRFQRRSLLSMQEERSKLMYMVLSSSSSSSSTFISSHNSALQEDTVQAPYHTVMQLDKMLSMVPL
ncbi:Tubulin epsilon and delta complex protein 1 [Merluccius polli]|uniref:Tubulin epsilon and delta complex protein 1 n=1 Tax=Merluccius polli TaxID=89951 RepID=A0AA47NNG2_MERPO|nr:Tubulin epsilon and delta complex protein 1 [Merluccius polli]